MYLHQNSLLLLLGDYVKLFSSFLLKKPILQKLRSLCTRLYWSTLASFENVWNQNTEFTSANTDFEFEIDVNFFSRLLQNPRRYIYISDLFICKYFFKKNNKLFTSTGHNLKWDHFEILAKG